MNWFWERAKTKIEMWMDILSRGGNSGIRSCEPYKIACRVQVLGVGMGWSYPVLQNLVCAAGRNLLVHARRCEPHQCVSLPITLNLRNSEKVIDGAGIDMC